MSCVMTYAYLFLTSEVMEAVRGQKHPSEAKHGMKELIHWKHCLIKVSQQPQKPSSGSNQIWAMTSDKKDTATDLRGHCIRLYVVAAANQTYRSKVATYVRYICCCCCAVINLINNWRMFNVEIDDLAEKPHPRARALRSPQSWILSIGIRDLHNVIIFSAMSAVLPASNEDLWK